VRFTGDTITDNGETYDLAYAKKAMLVIVILPLLVMYTEAMLTPALPQIQKEFAINPNDVSWILTIYLLVGTVSAAIFGKLGDMYGKVPRCSWLLHPRCHTQRLRTELSMAPFQQGHSGTWHGYIPARLQPRP